MLRALRDRSGKWFFRLLFILIAFSFVAMGIIEAIRNYHAARPVAKVGQKTVGFDGYYYTLQKMIHNIRSKEPSTTVKDLHRMNVFQNVLDEQIQELVIQQELDNYHLIVPEGMLKATVESLPFFHQDNQFQVGLFHRYLQAIGISEGEFLKRVNRQLLLQQLLKPLGDGIHLPQSYITELMRILYTPHHFQVITIPFSLKIDKNPTEEDLKVTHQKNSSQYRIPEKRHVRILSFTASDLIKSIPISEDELKSLYHQNKRQFIEPEQRHVHMLVYPTKMMAQMACDHLKKGDLATVLIKAPGGSYKDLGVITAEKAPKEFQHILFTVKHTGALPVVSLKNQEGFALFYIEKINAAYTKSFEEVKKHLKREMQLERSSEFIDKKRNRIEDDLGAGIAFEKIAQKHTLSLKSYALNQKGDGLNGVTESAQKALTEEIFQASASQVTPILEIISGEFYIVQIDKIISARVPPLAEIKKHVVHDWKFDQQKKKALSYAEDFSKKTFGALKTSFSAKNITIRQVDLLTGQFKLFPDHFIKRIFALHKNKSAYFLSDKEAFVVWYEKSDQIKSLPKDSGDFLNKIKELFEKDKESLILSAMQKNHTVEIYKDVLEEAYPKD